MKIYPSEEGTEWFICVKQGMKCKKPSLSKSYHVIIDDN